MIDLVEKEILDQIGTTGKGTCYILRGQRGHEIIHQYSGEPLPCSISPPLEKGGKGGFDQNDPRKYNAHETAIIDAPCEIGENTKIWRFSHILKGSKIGRNCIIGQNVVTVLM